MRNAYEAIFDVIDNRSYIPDPRNAGTTTKVRKMVYDSDPFNKAIDYSLCPYIVVKLPTQEPGVKVSLGVKQQLSYRQEVILRTVRKGSGGGRDDLGRTDSLNMTDDLLETFKSQTVLQTLRPYYIYNLEIEILNNDDIEMDDELYYETTIEITYRMALEVS